MKTLYIGFTDSTFALEFENDSLAGGFATVFQATETPRAPIHNTIKIRGNEATGFSVHLNNTIVRESLSGPEAAYFVTQIFGDDICSHVDGSVGVLHAASVLRVGHGVSFIGVSGAGKTSLALHFSRYGYFMGDEYAFVDLDTGDLWHEHHPYQLKARNEGILKTIDRTHKLAVEGMPFGRAYYISLDSTNYRKVERDDHVKLKDLVFPHYDDNQATTLIERLPSVDLPTGILQSLLGKDTPSLLFRRFLRLAAKEGIRFHTIKFSDGEDAAARLDEYLR